MLTIFSSSLVILQVLMLFVVLYEYFGNNYNPVPGALNELFIPSSITFTLGRWGIYFCSLPVQKKVFILLTMAFQEMFCGPKKR